MRSLIIIFLSTFFFISYCDPSSPPVWPNQFEQTFTETFTYPVLGSSSTKGKFFYDFINKRYRVDRDNGKWDRYCATEYIFRNTPCSHIVNEGKRYLYYPEKNYCCYCCDAAHGCGILKPDWLTGAKFIGIENDTNGKSFEKWDQQGLQHNYYYATNDDKRIMFKIDQQPNDLQTFDVDSFFEGIKDNNYLNLPNVCQGAKTCSLLSACTAVRNS